MKSKGGHYFSRPVTCSDTAVVSLGERGVRGMRATRELLRAVGIVARLTHRPAAAHDNTSRRAVASFSTTPLAPSSR